MRIADAFGLAGRVQRVAEKSESGGWKPVGDDIGGDTAAHRLPSDERLRKLRRYGLRDGAVTGFEPRLRVGPLPSHLGVREGAVTGFEPRLRVGPLPSHLRVREIDA